MDLTKAGSVKSMPNKILSKFFIWSFNFSNKIQVFLIMLWSFKEFLIFEIFESRTSETDLRKTSEGMKSQVSFDTLVR